MILNEDTIRLILGLKIRTLRSEKGISLTELALKTGVSVSYLNEIEKSKKHPKPSKIALIADALDVSYDQLVSLEMDKKQLTVARLLSSEFMKELPLEHFGLDNSTLIDAFTTAPARFGAFINTLIEIARSHDISVDQFYFDALRSFQEMHENYFGEIEASAQQLAELYSLEQNDVNLTPKLELILKEKFGITVSYQLQKQTGLAQLRSLYHSKKQQLLINGLLSTNQKAFILAKEIGFQFQELHDRPNTSAWAKSESFEAVLNNFKASYFAGALLISCDQLVEDMQQVFSSTTWDSEKLATIINSYPATSEVFMYRLTSILPKFFGLHQLFFLKFDHDIQSGETVLAKELHLAGLHNPHASFLNEHYCRRWISISLLENKMTKGSNEMKIGIQRSSYVNSSNEYLVISIARPEHPNKEKSNSLTIGLLINPVLAQKVQFLNDEKIISRLVNITCERCELTDCAERAAAPIKFIKKQAQERLINAIENFLNE
ncbi:helix-turn-helix domain-containing protein [Solitalea koreensis]|uniref:HTH cro/C1-type domain-containing protein n=1 Tax=Solitalea koreensis TaxID=543615 RepID=A0A521CL31_9SPHI|nr:XRE family transcriptional regulator [Solitalea koreensis]SMO59431.1 hypothetical protein SAMN06265350_104123 [Solitalea koreensis]